MGLDKPCIACGPVRVILGVIVLEIDLIVYLHHDGRHQKSRVPLNVWKMRNVGRSDGGVDNVDVWFHRVRAETEREPQVEGSLRPFLVLIYCV